jgi:hypothetical protein
MPDSGACADPTTIAATRTRARTSLADCGSSHAATTASPTSHIFLFSMHDHSAFIYTQQMEQDKASTEATSTFTIYHANKQGTQAACMYHQHAKHK